MPDSAVPPVFTRLPSRRNVGVAAFVIPNLLISTLGLPPLNALPPGMQRSEGVAPSARKYLPRIDPRSNELLLVYAPPAIPPIPIGLRLDTGFATIVRKPPPKIDVYPNNLNKLLFTPTYPPFNPQDLSRTPWRAKTLSADMSIVAYQVDTVPTESTKAPIFTQLPTRKRQLRVDMAQNLLLVNPPPAGPAAQPIGKQLQFLSVQRKKQVYDLNLLWPNSRLFGPIPVPFAPLINQDFSGIHSKYEVFDLNYLWANSQIPGIPPPTPVPPGGNVGKTRPGGRMIIDPKRQGEKTPIPFDFISRIGAGESISSVSCSCSVWSGTDPNPSAVLSGSPTYSGIVASQVVQDGLVGVIYAVIMTITTNLGNRSEMLALLAIEQDASA